jgi:hypothetical protein
MESTQVVVTKIGDPGPFPFYVVGILLMGVVSTVWYLLWRYNPVFLDKLIIAIKFVLAGMLLVPGFVLPIIRPNDLPWGAILICIGGMLIGSALSNMLEDHSPKPYLQAHRPKFWERSR